MGSHAQIFFWACEISERRITAAREICSAFQALRPALAPDSRIYFPSVRERPTLRTTPGGRAEVWDLSIADRVAAPHAFPQNSKNFFLLVLTRPWQPQQRDTLQKTSRNSGWGVGRWQVTRK